MTVFKFVISEPSSRKSFQTEVDQTKAAALIGKKIGEEFNGDIIGLNGYVLEITGGTDKDGFPMHPSLKGSIRKKILLTSPPGFHPSQKGQRRRKMMRGNTISEDIVQINVKVMKVGEKPFEQLVPKKEEKKPAEVEEKKPEEKPKKEKPKPKEEKPKEKKEEKSTKKPEADKPKEAEKPKEVETAKKAKKPEKPKDAEKAKKSEQAKGPEKSDANKK